MNLNRLDPRDVAPDELAQLIDFVGRTPALQLVRENSETITLPQVLTRHLLQVLDLMSRGQTVMLIPEDEQFTTQAAANYLGCSRQFLVNLLEDGAIPFEKVGTHRRVRFHDLRAYAKNKDKERHEALDELTQLVSDAGLYSPSVDEDGLTTR